MLPIEKVVDGETGEGKASAIFNAQWYPHVTAYVKRTGGSAHSVKLQGSLNGTDWSDIGSALTDNGFLTNYESTKGYVWCQYFRLYITTNTEGTLDCWMGAGGA